MRGWTFLQGKGWRPGTVVRWFALKGVFKRFLKPGMQVLDLGGFDGSIEEAIRGKILIDPIIVDLDEQGLELAGSKGFKILCASATDLPLPDGSADAVLALDLLEHISSDQEAFAEMVRVLRKGGLLIITTPRKGRRFALRPPEEASAIHKEWGHVREGYTREELGEMIQAHRLETVWESRFFSRASELAYYHLARRPEKWCKVLFEWIARIAEAFPSIYGFEMVLVLKK